MRTQAVFQCRHALRDYFLIGVNGVRDSRPMKCVKDKSAEIHTNASRDVKMETQDVQCRRIGHITSGTSVPVSVTAGTLRTSFSHAWSMRVYQRETVILLHRPSLGP